jgi:hypothetical protein
MIYAHILRVEVPRAVLVSAAYLIAFAATFLLVEPLQSSVIGDIPAEVSLCFLPHGVRVIAAWLFGWRSVLYLMVPTLAMQPLVYGDDAYTIGPLLIALVGVTCAPLAFSLMSLAGSVEAFTINRPRWRFLMLAGTLASIMNSAAAVIIMSSDAGSIAAYWVGDIGGLFVALVTLLFVVRLVRRVSG